MKYIIDSSVIITILLAFDKDKAYKISTILDSLDSEFLVSDLTKFEVSNVLIYEVNELAKAEEFYKHFQDIIDDFITIDQETLKYARFIAKEVNDTVYDASYHAAAILSNMTFLTLDRKYYNKAKHLGHIKLLD